MAAGFPANLPRRHFLFLRGFHSMVRIPAFDAGHVGSSPATPAKDCLGNFANKEITVKKYIAFVGGTCSTICTIEEATAWASKHLANNAKTPSVFIAEVTQTVERSDMPVVTKTFFAAPETDSSVAKAA
jgi:hypothetical protein